MAQSSMQDVLVGAGKGTLDFTLNRRVLQKDGRVLYLPRHPGLTPNQVVDSEVGVVSFRKLDKRPLVTVMNYSCHPLTVGFVPRQVSADFPGAATRELEARLFGSAIYTNGACANIHPRKHCEGFKAMEEFGRALADTVLEVMPYLETRKHVNLRCVCKSVVLEVKPENMNENEDIREFRSGTTIDFEIIVLAINNIAFIGIPGEYFVEFQLEIKKKSPFLYTFFLTNSKGYVGYIPTAEAYDQGGYEVDSTKLQRGSGEKIRDEILELLTEVRQA
jgi:hypothetical protein